MQETQTRWGDERDCEPVAELILASEVCFLMEDWTWPTRRAAGDTGERTGSWGSSARGEKTLESGMSSLPILEESKRGREIFLRPLATDSLGGWVCGERPVTTA